MKCTVACLLILFCLNTIQAQIKWDENRPLTWKDFNGAIDYKSIHYANTKTSTNYQYQVRSRNNVYKLTFNVECVFLPSGSWCKPYKQTKLLLNHEQLHFDIEELFARKLMAAFKVATFTNNYIVEIKNIYTSIAKEANATQKKYDVETSFSEMKTEQMKWEKFVQEQLQKTPSL